MPDDSEHADYKARHAFVFDDRLGFSEETKHLIETNLDHPFEERTTIASSISDVALTAERKRGPDDYRYILVREATEAEEDALYGGDEDDDEEDEAT